MHFETSKTFLCVSVSSVAILNFIKRKFKTIAMPKQSAGILLYRFNNNSAEVLLVHPGGPFWAKKDAGAWSVPKGEFEDDELPLNAAVREFEEETGIKIQGSFIELRPVKQKSGKLIYAWALQKDINPENIISNTFEVEWPPKSGNKKTFPEIDKAAWFNIDEAKQEINEGQIPLLAELELKLSEQNGQNIS